MTVSSEQDMDTLPVTVTVRSVSASPSILDNDGNVQPRQLHRILNTRHLVMLGLGSSIGMGLWLGSGTSLANGGPAALVVGYVIATSMLIAVAHSVGELAVLYPLPSASIQWTVKFIDPAAGFALGWTYWIGAWVAIAAELSALITVLSFWTSAISPAASVAIFWAVLASVNIGAVRWFAEMEAVAAAIKFGWIIVVIVSMIVITAGGAPASQEAIGFQYWTESGGLTNGFKGFLSVMPTCIFAMAGAESIGLAAAETREPRRSIPRAVDSLLVLLGLFYLIGSFMVTLTVSPYNADLFGSSGTNASPFVIAYRDAGLTPLAHMSNAIIFLSILSSGSIAGYGGSRVLVGLSQIHMAPRRLQWVDKSGRPWIGLVPTLLIGGGVAYLNLAEESAVVFTWLLHLTSLMTLFGWSIICLVQIRMRYAWKLQGRNVDALPWQSWAWRLGAPYYALAMCCILIIAELYLSVSPLTDTPSVKTFFANYVSAIAIVVFWLVAKLCYRGRRWVDLSKVDLDDGRRLYDDEMKISDRESSNRGSV